MKRGDLVAVALQDSFGKPRPALVIQADFFAHHPSVTVLPVTSELHDTPLFRIAIQPSPQNGLQQPSQIMVDKAITVLRDKISEPFGELPPATMTEVDRSLAIFLGIAK